MKNTKYEILVNNAPAVCLSLISAISLLSLYSWFTDQVEFASFGVMTIPMAPITAIFFIIISTDLILKSKISRHRVAGFFEKIILLLISIIAILFILEDITNFSHLIGYFNFNTNQMYLGAQLWKMSPLTGICIVLSMLSLQIKLYLSNNEIADKIFTLMQLVTIAIAITIIVGYGYNTPLLYGGTIIPVALPTAICFFLLTIVTLTSFGNNTIIIKAFSGTTVTSNLIRTIIPIMLISIIGMGLIEMICVNYNIISRALLSAISLITNIIILNVAIVFASRKIGLLIDMEIKKRKLSEHELLKSNNDLEEINAQLEEEIAVRTKIEDALKASELQFRRALDEAPIPIMLRADDGEVLKISSKWTEITGYTIQDIPTFNEWTTKAYGSDDPSSQTVDGEYKITTTEGKVRIWEFKTANIGKIDDGRKVAMTAATDITERKRTEEALKESEGRLIAAQLMAHVGNWELNLGTEVIWASEEAFNIYGIEYFSQYLPLDLVQECALPEYRESLNIALSSLITRKEKYDEEYKIKNVKTGEERFVHSKAILLFDEIGNASKVAGTIQDITERKEKEIEILYLSYHDQLTGLYNRRFYEEELKRLDTERNLPMTIVIGDVNGLKLINDSFGHATGDELIKKVADVIRRGCRADDIIARLGGDEFVILLPKTDVYVAEQIIKRIKVFASKVRVGSIDISISFGYETKNYVEENNQEIFKMAEDHMYKKKLFEGPSMRGKTIKAIINTLYEKNKREEQHSYRVSLLCESMGKAHDLSEGEIQELKSVGLLHDIGKIAIEEYILNKPGKLTDAEWEEIKRHPEIGYRILSTVNDMSEMSEYVLAHHERWDGNGYPKGLKRNEIPFQSRIINIVDSYDAMTSERSYSSALSEEAAIEELQKNAGTQFDPELVRVFIEKVLDNREQI